MSNTSFQGRIALVTGASRGIGRAAALALADAGAHVIAVARTVGALEELDDQIQAKGGTTTLVPLDLKDSAGIDRMGAAIFERWGKLDMLLANAGILGTITPITHLSPKMWDEVIAINLTSNFRLIRSLDQLLRLSDAGRAVFVSSAAAVKNMPFWGGYAISKAGLDTMVKTYAGELTGTTVKVNLFYPGPTRTGMRAKAMPGEDPMSLPAPEELCPLILDMLSPGYDANGEVVVFKRQVS
jgi:NAD(P)-dependent dehydrogenase (short-subunit alcohol dehydrogenase family)